jgi:phosphoribosylformylglycinamidine cyclo-ligase
MSTPDAAGAAAPRTNAPANAPVNAPTRAPEGPLDYRAAGVDYDLIDPLKVAAQRAAAATAGHLAGRGYTEVAASRGESAYVVDVGPFYLASIVECLGTKALIADEMQRLTGRSHYAAIAQDTIAMAVNDLVTVGATPLVVQAYWAGGGSDWFADRTRAEALVAGWKAACDRCGVAWGGGETPALAGVVADGRIDLAAACTGVVQPKQRLSVGMALGPGDAIVLVESSGIHANGVSLARKLAERLPQGWLTRIGEGADAPTYGEALLVPTLLYPPLTEALHRAGIVPHYCANVTGHGWRKLMRHPKPLRYRIHTLPDVPPVLGFVRERLGLEAREAYGTFNMGAGFALYVARADVARTLATAQAVGLRAWDAGTVEAGSKEVVIEPIDLVFGGDELQLR